MVMDFGNYNNPPVFKVMKPLYSDFFKQDYVLNIEFNLMRNNFVLADTFLQLLKWFNTNGHFLSIGLILPKNKVGISQPGVFFINKFWLQSEITFNKRKIFGWFDLLGKLGGITNVMMLLFGWILFGVSEHSFVLKAAKKLFLARTKDNNLFKHDPRANTKVAAFSKRAREELDKHRPIKLHLKDNILLYLSNHWSRCFPMSLWPEGKKF
jgi:hypothetical protein